TDGSWASPIQWRPSPARNKTSGEVTVRRGTAADCPDPRIVPVLRTPPVRPWDSYPGKRKTPAYRQGVRLDRAAWRSQALRSLQSRSFEMPPTKEGNSQI